MQEILIAAQGVLSLDFLLLSLVGTILGIFFGAMPGLNTSTGIILVLPVIYELSLMHSLSLLLGMYVGGVSGGLITAILLNVPGTPAAVVTCFDGHPMTQRGEAGKALSIGIFSSFIGGMISFAILFLVSPILSKFALSFSAPEYLALSIFALLTVSGLSGDSFAKGIMSVSIGVLISCIGMSPADSAKRFTFGMYELNGGIQLIAILVGVYAMKEIFKYAQAKKDIKSEVPKFSMKSTGITKQEVKEQSPNVLRSALIGTFVGFLPGLGANTASFMSYSVAKNQSKQKEEYGKGHIGGIVASETANNAVIGGALIPLLSLGIPGSTTVAVLLSAFIMKGVQPGPLLFENDPVLVYSIFTMLVVANIFMLIVELFSIPTMIKILKIPQKYIFTIVIILCVIGAYSANDRLFDVWTLIPCSILGFLFYKYKLPIGPIVIGYILTSLIEQNLYRGLTLTGGSYLGLITRPISGTIFAVSIIYFGWTVISNYRRSKKNQKVA